MQNLFSTAERLILKNIDRVFDTVVILPAPSDLENDTTSHLVIRGSFAADKWLVKGAAWHNPSFVERITVSSPGAPIMTANWLLLFYKENASVPAAGARTAFTNDEIFDLILRCPEMPSVHDNRELLKTFWYRAQTLGYSPKKPEQGGAYRFEGIKQEL